MTNLDYHNTGYDMNDTQPKPTGEWTARMVDQAELRSLREKVMELEQQLAAAEKALSEEVDCVHKTLMQLADEREQSARNVSALAKAHKEQLAAERKRANEAEQKVMK